MIEIRVPAEEDRERIAGLQRIAFNIPAAPLRLLAPHINLANYVVASEGTRIVAMANGHPIQHWFGGRSVPAVGIASVAAVPERRGEGLAPKLVARILTERRERGALFSSLYPSRAAVYRRLGYEYGGVLVQHRAALGDLPDEKGGSCEGAAMEEMDEEALGEVRACYRAFARGHNGPLDSDDPTWWRLRVVRRWNPDANTRAVVCRGRTGEVEGYATFGLESGADPLWGYRIVCTHLVARTRAAVHALAGYFRSFRGMGHHLQWYGPPADPIGTIAGGGADAVQPARTLRFMVRILDVAGALEARGYPAVEGEAVFAVKDDLFPENDGPFRIRASGGRVQVERVGKVSPPVLPIGALSALFTGYLDAGDLARAGLLPEEAARLPLLCDLFRGPTPWVMDFF